MTRERPLDGQAAIVTGAAMGLGLAYADVMARAGCNLALFDIHPDVETAGDDLRRHGGRVVVVRGDVREPHAVRRLVDATIAAFGRIDILINNAGVCRYTRPTDPLDASLDNYDVLIGTNLRGPFMLGRAVMPTMIAAGSGNIINIATDHVHTFPGRPTNGFGVMDLYDASKWGLIGLTLTWAKALKDHGVRVNAFCMDATVSPMLLHFAGPNPASHAVARWMDPKAVCALALDLILEGPDGRTGENIGVWCGFEIALTHTPRPLADGS